MGLRTNKKKTTKAEAKESAAVIEARKAKHRAVALAYARRMLRDPRTRRDFLIANRAGVPADIKEAARARLRAATARRKQREMLLAQRDSKPQTRQNTKKRKGNRNV